MRQAYSVALDEVGIQCRSRLGSSSESALFAYLTSFICDMLVLSRCHNLGFVGQYMYSQDLPSYSIWKLQKKSGKKNQTTKFQHV